MTNCDCPHPAIMHVPLPRFRSAVCMEPFCPCLGTTDDEAIPEHVEDDE